MGHLGQVFLALDGMGYNRSMDLTEKVGSRVHAVKVHDLLDAHGPRVFDFLRKATARNIFADAKLHDIPNTVSLRAFALANAGADYISVHASGGLKMLEAATEGARRGNGKILAITVLTSLEAVHEVPAIYGGQAWDVVLKFALMAKRAGVYGVVCSAKEVGLLAAHPDLRGLKLIVPGTRSPGKDTHDQQRVDTPAAALAAGADYLVIGRQLTKAPDPIAALDELEAEIADAPQG
jgi:orotidine-5'-phosphate decarboxylase